MHEDSAGESYLNATESEAGSATGSRSARPVVFESRLTRGDFLKGSIVTTASLSMAGLLISACDSGGEAGPDDNATPPPRPTGAMTIAVLGPASGLDPARGFGLTEFYVAQSVFDPLVQRDVTDPEKLVPSLAADWRASADAREWIGELRPGVKFHDGTALDSSAVRASIEYWAAAPGLGSTLGLSELEVDDRDPAVVRITSKAGAPDLSRNLTLVAIMAPEQMRQGEAAFNRDGPIGTGPFVFEAREGRNILLSANPDYWGDGPHVEEASIEPIPDLAARVAALETGQVNLVSSIPAIQARALESSPDVSLETAELWRNSLLIFKTTTAPVDDPNLRKAIAYAIDRDALAESDLGEGEPADAILPPGVYGYQPMEPQYPFDPDKARELLAQVNNGEPVSLRMAALAGDFSGLTTNLAEALADQMEAVGIQVDLDLLQEARFNTVTGLADTPYHVIFTALSYITGGPSVLSGGLLTQFSALEQGEPASINRQVAELTEKVNTTPDGPERLEAIASLQNVFAERLPVFPLFTLVGTDGATNDLHGYAVPPDGISLSLADCFIS